MMEKEMRWRKLIVKNGEDDQASGKLQDKWRKSRHLKCSHTQDKTQNIWQSSLITQAEFLYYVQNVGENIWGKTPY